MRVPDSIKQYKQRHHLLLGLWSVVEPRTLPYGSSCLHLNACGLEPGEPLVIACTMPSAQKAPHSPSLAKQHRNCSIPGDHMGPARTAFIHHLVYSSQDFLSPHIPLIYSTLTHTSLTNIHMGQRQVHVWHVLQIPQSQRQCPPIKYDVSQRVPRLPPGLVPVTRC